MTSKNPPKPSLPVSVKLRDVAASLGDWFFPASCMACHVPLGSRSGDFLCAECRRDIRLIDPPPCPCLETPDPPMEARAKCEFCRRLPPSFATIRSGFPYAGVAGDLIRNLKYRHSEQVGHALARLLIAVLGEHFQWLKDEAGVEVIVPVPMHLTRHWRRGYNQAACIAEALSEFTKIPHEPHAIRRIRRTPPQVRRAKTLERLKNVANAFDVPEPERVAGKRILLIDDVMTTGATMASCAAAAKDAGAVSIHVVTVARAGSGRLKDAPIEMTGAVK